MTIQKRKLFLCVCCLLAIFFVSGCDSREEKQVRNAVEKELRLLKTADNNIAAQYIQSEDLIQLSPNAEILSEDITHIFQLFYKNFSYETNKISIKKNRAVVHTNLKILDSQKLAKDFVCLSLKKSIEQEAMPSEVQPSSIASYELLRKLLESETYKTKTVSADSSLKKEKEQWTVLHTSELDDILTGHFFSYITDPELLSPSEIVKTHFKTIKGFDSEQLKLYLSLDSLADAGDSYGNTLIHAVTGQISRSFDFKIKEETIDNTSAIVQASITSVDFQSIFQNYQEELAKWLKTSEALAGGIEGRRQKEHELLLSAVEKNKAFLSRDVKIPLINDGVNWKIQMTPELSQAIFGDMQDTLDTIT